MTRARLHLLIDVLMAGVGFALLQTGLLLYFVLPAHSRADTVLGLTRHDWGQVHFWLAVAVLTLLLVHLVLNWNWVCGVVYKLFAAPSGPLGRGRTAAGLGLLAAAVGLSVGLVFAAEAARVADPSPRGPGSGWRQLDEGPRGGGMHRRRPADDDELNRAKRIFLQTTLRESPMK